MNRVLRVICLTVVIAGYGSTAALAQSRADDEQAIQTLLVAFVDAWNRHDMTLWKPLFTENADFVVVTAKHLKGREEIISYHDSLHKGLFKDHRMKARWEDLRFLRASIAVGHIRFEPGNEKSKRTALATAVLVKERDKWLIAALQNTLLYGPPLPEQFPPSN